MHDDIPYMHDDTLSDKFFAEKNFGEQNFSADKIPGNNSKFRQFCPTKIFQRFIISPYVLQEILT